MRWERDSHYLPNSYLSEKEEIISSSYKYPGHTDFDVADKLAILNLVNSYSETYDRDHIDEWFALFTEEPKVTGHMGDQEPFCIPGQNFRDFFRERHSLSDLAGGCWEGKRSQ